MKLFRLLILLILVNGLVLSVAAEELQFKTKMLSIGNHKLVVEIAESEQQRQVGLMNRKVLDKDHGMLFVLDRNSSVCFWMKNTLIPLSIAFVSEYGVITQIEHMLPMSTKLVCSYKEIKYGLEVNQGWFENNNIDEGMTVQGINHPIPYIDIGWFKL